MLHSTFILSLLASAAFARVLPRMPLLDDSALPSFALVAPGATIDPISSVAPIVTPTPTPTPMQVGGDQPAPYDPPSIISSRAPALSPAPQVPAPTTNDPVYTSTPCSTPQVPASPTFDPSNAPAFTPAPGAPTGNPVYSTTPCSTIKVPASETFDPSNAPAFTPAPGAPTGNPVYSSTPCETPTATPSPIISIETPTPKVPSNGKATPSSAALPVQTPTYGSGQGEKEPCDEDDKAPAQPSVPVPFGSAPPASIPASGSPSFPTMIGRPNERPGFGWFRPRPQGAWPHGGAPRPTKAYGHPLPPNNPAGVGASKANAASTPCTLKTRVRPTATAL